MREVYTSCTKMLTNIGEQRQELVEFEIVTSSLALGVSV